MSTSKNIFEQLPSVLSFQRCISTTDAVIKEINEQGEVSDPVYVTMEGSLGVLPKARSTKVDNPNNLSNPQESEVAKTSADATGIVVEFAMNPFSIRNTLHSVALGKDDKVSVPEFRDAINDYYDRAIADRTGLTEISNRYARNIANARWVWRNEKYSHNIEVTVIPMVNGEIKPSLVFTSKRTGVSLISMDDFDNYTNDELQLGEYIAQAIIDGTSVSLKISAKLDFGFSGRHTVYPSQRFNGSGYTGSSNCKKFLYTIIGKSKDKLIAAFRAEKVANAIRTIDTWYPGNTHGPIAIEMEGQSLKYQQRFRENNTANDVIKTINALDPASDDGMYLSAIFIRGGVFADAKDHSGTSSTTTKGSKKGKKADTAKD